MKKKILLSTIITLVSLILIFKIIDWKTIISLTKELKTSQIIIAFLFLSLANVIRSLRFYKLNYHEQSFVNWWITAQIYNMMTATLPGGFGEAVTAYILKKFLSIDLLVVIRILIISRIMDLGSLSALTLLSSLQVKTAANYSDMTIVVSSILMILSFVLIIPAYERKMIRYLQYLLPKRGPILERVQIRIIDLHDTLQAHNNKDAFIASLYSLLVALGAAISTYWVLQGYGVNFTWQQSFYCFGIYALFQIVPIQGIAGIGTQAAWWALALTSAGYQGSDAVALGMLLHGTFYVFITIMAIIALLVSQFYKRRYS